MKRNVTSLMALTSIVAMGILAASVARAQGPLNWLNNTVSINDSWSGDVPWLGMLSDSSHTDSGILPVVLPPIGSSGGRTWVLGLTGAATGVEALYLWDVGLVELKVVYDYNDPDHAERTFHIDATNTHIFRLTQPVELAQVGLETGLGPWDVNAIDAGSWNIGTQTWTHSGMTVDLSTLTGTVVLPVGEYRFRANVSSTFTDHAAFSHETSVRWQVYRLSVATRPTTWGRLKDLYRQ